jgi:molybdenum cofactor cytidylyltransferase
MQNHHIIILAAGESRRMGEPKQLLVYKGMPLIERAFITAAQVSANRVTVVLGAAASAILEKVPSIFASTIFNEEWSRGMGASISRGMQFVRAHFPLTDAITFMTVDQPYVTSRHLQELLDAHTRLSKPIVASAYNGIAGIPSLFGSEYFAALAELDSQKGAKDIIDKFPHDVATVPFADAATDVDTPLQFALLK